MLEVRKRRLRAFSLHYSPADGYRGRSTIEEVCDKYNRHGDGESIKNCCLAQTAVGLDAAMAVLKVRSAP